MTTILVCIGCVLVCLFVICFLAKRESFDFESRFPPISDAEFLTRCGPGTDPEIALGVRRIVSEKLGIEYERIHPDARFIDDLGAD